jgi:hypothetical protein
LSLEVKQIFAPGGATIKTKHHTKDFMRQIKNANNMGINKLLLVDDCDDLLILLKAGKLDEVLKNNFLITRAIPTSKCLKKT